MYPCSTIYRATDKQRISHWERCLVTIWKIPEPEEGWKESLQLRDEQGLTKYP